MVITIDGPAGAGKSTVAKALARRLGFRYLDTGAMYRTVALAGLRRGVDWQKPDELASVAETLDMAAEQDRILLEGIDVSEEIRSVAVTAVTRYAAGNLRIRRHLVAVQRAMAGDGRIVTEGRDQGTLVFPDAACKFFLTASTGERAKRRLCDALAQGESVSLAEILQSQARRDEEDSTRSVGALAPAPDAVIFNTDGLNSEQVVDQLEAMVRAKCGLQ